MGHTWLPIDGGGNRLASLVCCVWVVFVALAIILLRRALPWVQCAGQALIADQGLSSRLMDQALRYAGFRLATWFEVHPKLTRGLAPSSAEAGR